MSQYRPLPKPGDPDEFAFGRQGPRTWGPPRPARWAEDAPFPVRPELPAGLEAAIATPSESGDDATSEAPDEPTALRRSMLREIELALAAEDGAIACFHVTLANVYAKRLVALAAEARSRD